MEKTEIDFNIIVDNSEPDKLYQLIKEHPLLKPTKMNLKEIRAGDFIVGTYVIERKTVYDFVNSIKDKRIWSQLSQMKYAQGDNQVILLIEGAFQSLYRNRQIKFNANMKNGVLNSVELDFDIRVCYTANHRKTVEFLARLLERSEGTQKTYHALREKGLKKKTPEEVAQYILEGFPGVGPKTAIDLLKHYNQFNPILGCVLFELLENDDHNPCPEVLLDSQWKKIRSVLDTKLEFE